MDSISGIFFNQLRVWRQYLRYRTLGACCSTSDVVPGDLTALSTSKVSIAIKQRRVSCVDAMEAYLARIECDNLIYNAIVSMANEAVTDYLSRRSELA